MFRKKYKTALPTNFLPNLIQLFSPTLIIILIIFLIVALLIGIVFILLKGLFTAVMVGGTLFVMVWLIRSVKKDEARLFVVFSFRYLRGQ